MIDLLHSQSGRHSSTPIRHNRDFQADLAWWRCLVEEWNSISFLDRPELLNTQHAASYTSRKWGCGAWSLPQWFQWQWTKETKDWEIAMKEMIPIALDCAVWGHKWIGHHVIWHSDNQAVVSCLRSRTSRHPLLMHLIHNITFYRSLLRLLCAARVH